VDGIERDLEGKAQVLRLTVGGGVGRELAERYVVRSIPTLVVLDGNGHVVLKQAGPPIREEILAAVEQLGQ
jgi:thioredoxin-related protein